jgi:hypothetical protein
VYISGKKIHIKEGIKKMIGQNWMGKKTVFFDKRGVKKEYSYKLKWQKIRNENMEKERIGILKKRYRQRSSEENIGIFSTRENVNI